MNSPSRYSFALLAGVFVLTYLVFAGSERSRADRDTPVIDGTWTEEAGTPGNSIHIYSVRAPMPENYWGLECYEGRMDFKRHFGEEKLRTSWNFGSFEPLILNVILPGKKVRFARVRVVDSDHLLVRFGDDLEALEREGAFRHGDVKPLTRTR
jgi:hypothetical protein